MTQTQKTTYPGPNDLCSKCGRQFQKHLATGTGQADHPKNACPADPLAESFSTSQAFTPIPAPAPTRHALAGAEAARLLSEIRAVLWQDSETFGLDPGKERTLEQLDAIADTLADAGLAPPSPEPYQDIALEETDLAAKKVLSRPAPAAPHRAVTGKPHDHSANPFGVFLLEKAAKPGCTLDKLFAQAIGAFSTCDTLEQFSGVQRNLKLAEEILFNR